MLSFNRFKLERTNFSLEYATVEPNRWDNYCWWSNTDLPMIKRMSKKHQAEKTKIKKGYNPNY